MRIIFHISLLFSELSVIWRKTTRWKGTQMTSLGNKQVISKNLKNYILKSGRTQKELAEIVGVAPSTFNDWVTGKKYPRIDKIEMLANLFGILKSDLIEDKTEMQKNNDAITDIIIRLRSDKEYFELCMLLKDLDPEKITGMRLLLPTLLK